MPSETNRIQGRLLVTRDTTANWNSHPSFIPMSGEVIVYTDHKTITDEHGNNTYVPGIKIGDGNAYLIDLPFCDEALRRELVGSLQSHVGNTQIHVTPNEKSFWNNKLNYRITGQTLQFVVTGNEED